MRYKLCFNIKVFFVWVFDTLLDFFFLKAYGGRVTTRDLVNRIFNFCEVYSGKVMYKYQEQMSKRYILSVLENDGEEITGLFSRQSGKTETIAITTGGLMIILPRLANMPMFLNDPRFEMFKDGFWVGIFAPSMRQSQITYNRMRTRMNSKEAQAVLNDPDFNLQFSTSNGTTVSLTNGSYCMAISASDNSNIEGETFKVIICEECQDISNYKIRKSIHPMGAAYNATLIKIGTPTTFKGDFYETIKRNKEREKDGGKKNHFEYNYRVVMKYNPKYAKYVEREKERLGETSDEFRMSYCVTPDTRILTSDLRWVRAEDIKKGDSLLGFDENPPKRYGQRKYKESFVEDVGRIERPCYEVILSNGQKVKCSEEHQWLVFTAGSRAVWKKTKDLVSTDRIYKVCDTWDNLPTDYRLGYLAAAFDGEGCISQVQDKINQITFSQRANTMLDQVERYLKDFGFTYNDDFYDKRKVGNGQEPCYRLIINGGKRELLRFLGSVRPERLLENFDPNKLGTVRCSNGDLGKEYHPSVVELNYIGMQEVIPIRTTTRTYIAEGLASHNCLEWIISRGMFVDIDELEKLCGEDYLERVESDTKATHVAGIDIGGGSDGKNKKQADSTVVTIVEVDWDNPVLLDTSYDAETNKDIVYMAFNTYIKDWLELSPETAENYEEQFSILIEYFKRWRIAKCVIDATREASLSQRIAANVNFEVIPFVFGVKSKSELYKHLQTEIKTGRARYPMGAITKETPEYKKFIEQMGDLQKSYRGADMVVSHPDEKGAHDDYSDSWALAVFGARDRGFVDETETMDRNVALRDKRYVSSLSSFNRNRNPFGGSVTSRRNRKTAKRR